MRTFSELMEKATAMYNEATEGMTFDATKDIFVYDFDESTINEDGYFSATNGWDSDSYDNACKDMVNNYYPSVCRMIATINEGETVRCFVYLDTENDNLLLSIMFNEESWG